jgi:hypothetical protein
MMHGNMNIKFDVSVTLTSLGTMKYNRDEILVTRIALWLSKPVFWEQ